MQRTHGTAVRGVAGCVRPLGRRMRRRCGSVRCGGELADQADPRDRADRARHRRRRRVPAGVPRAVEPARPADRRSRTAAAPAAPSAPPRPPRPIPTATRSSRSPPRTPSRRRSIRTCRYDVTRDFIAVVPFGRMPTALIISPSKGIKTVQELVAEAKAKPGALHLRLGGCRIDHASDRRALPAERGHSRPSMCRSAAAASARGHRRAASISPFRRSRVAVPDVRDGRLLALAVSARDRASAFPDVPTTLEAGYRELRLCALARRVRAGENAARHRRPAASTRA